MPNCRKELFYCNNRHKGAADIRGHRGREVRQDKVFELHLDVYKVDIEIATNMRGRRHSRFNVDNLVRIETDDH
jgi:hypothetical protein